MTNIYTKSGPSILYANVETHTNSNISDSITLENVKVSLSQFSGESKVEEPIKNTDNFHSSVKSLMRKANIRQIINS